MPPSDRPAPLGWGTEIIDGAKTAMVEKSPTRGAASSMNLRVITASGSVSVSTPRAGAAAATGLDTVPVTTTASTSSSSFDAAAAAVVAVSACAAGPIRSPAASAKASIEHALGAHRRR